jgi:hypothetical protein
MDPTVTNLEKSPYRLATGKGVYCVRLDTLQGIPANLAPRTVRFDPNPRIFGNGLGQLYLCGQPTVCLGLPCKV